MREVLAGLRVGQFLTPQLEVPILRPGDRLDQIFERLSTTAYRRSKPPTTVAEATSSAVPLCNRALADSRVRYATGRDSPSTRPHDRAATARSPCMRRRSSASCACSTSDRDCRAPPRSPWLRPSPAPRPRREGRRDTSTCAPRAAAARSSPARGAPGGGAAHARGSCRARSPALPWPQSAGRADRASIARSPMAQGAEDRSPPAACTASSRRPPARAPR